MKNTAVPFLCALMCLLSACSSSVSETEPEIPETVSITVSATTPATLPSEPEPETVPDIQIQEPVLELTEDEKNMLLKIGMAERGKTGCTQCIALVMRTILNRVENDRFGSSIQKVLFAPEQFTPVMDGSYYSAEPNECCYDALEMVVHGWDESQGALFYEWCEGESWHSQNLHLLFRHCDVRFYD